jgi:hypothetical protein
LYSSRLWEIKHTSIDQLLLRIEAGTSAPGYGSNSNLITGKLKKWDKQQEDLLSNHSALARTTEFEQHVS